MATQDYMAETFEGLLFVNLIEFNLIYGHRNDSFGFANAFQKVDESTPIFADFWIFSYTWSGMNFQSHPTNPELLPIFAGREQVGEKMPAPIPAIFKFNPSTESLIFKNDYIFPLILQILYNSNNRIVS